jgi:hypothetical protein
LRHTGSAPEASATASADARGAPIIAAPAAATLLLAFGYGETAGMPTQQQCAYKNR